MQDNHNDVLVGNITSMDLKKALEILGDDVKKTFTQLYALLYTSAVTLLLVGPPGSGKSHTGEALCREYAKAKGCNFYFMQGDAQLTKAGAVGGMRLDQGTSKPFLSTLAVAAEKGDIVFFDEVPHANEAVQTALNTLLDRSGRTSIGHHTVIVHPNFRVVLAGNSANFAGNVAFVPSFAGRLITIPFDYPAIDTEARIAKLITQKMLRGSDYAKIERTVVKNANGLEEEIDRVILPVPTPVIKHVTALFREIRAKNPMLTTSARNMANMLYCLCVWAKDENASIASELVTGTHAEPKQGQIAKRVFWVSTASNQQIKSPDTVTFMQYVSSLSGGLATYRNLVASNTGILLDIKGVSATTMAKLRTEVEGMIV